MATPKECYSLLGYFEKQYKAKYGSKPNVNKYVARWGFDAMLEGGNVDDIKSIIDYYFTTASPVRHKLEWFFNNYHKLEEARSEAAKDEELQKRLRSETEERVREWRLRRGDE